MLVVGRHWGLVAAAAALALSPNGRDASGAGAASGEAPAGAEAVAAQPEGVGARAAPEVVTPAALAKCAACHRTPTPDLLPKERWPRMLEHMSSLMEQYDLAVKLTPEELFEVKKHFVAVAPPTVALLDEDFTPSPIAFAGVPMGMPAMPPKPGEKAQPPMMGQVRIVDLDRSGRPDVLVCDIAGNKVVLLTEHQGPGQWAEADLIPVPAPAQLDIADMDGDGHLDILVASVGGLQPTDEPVGSITLFLGDGRFGYRRQVIADKTPRASDVKAVDIDGDGDLDVVGAFFGMYKTGQVAWFRQDVDAADKDGRRAWTAQTIYQRNGVSHVAPIDANHDGRPDLAVLVSQEHEEIVLLTNTGIAAAASAVMGPALTGEAEVQATGSMFTPSVLWQAPHPLWGFSSMRTCDLDQDGDLDILATNGDALDIDAKPKRWHGAQWLENRTPRAPAAGGAPVGGLAPTFVYHDLARFHGAYSIAPGDLDGDGDLDLVVTSMMNDWSQPSRSSIIWLESEGTGKGERRSGAQLTFKPHSISTSPCYLVSSDVADLTGEGRPDIIATSMYVFEPYYRVGRITAWVNRGAPPPPPPTP
jgi:hypothetical protein